MSETVKVAVNQVIKFDGKRTNWRVRAVACGGRYALATSKIFAKVYYTIIDTHESVRGPMNVIGGGLGIFTTEGHDSHIDEAIAMLEGTGPLGGGWEVSSRNQVDLNISEVKP